MLIVRNPRTQLPMDLVVSKGYPYGLSMIDVDSTAVHDGKEFVAEIDMDIAGGATEEFLFISPIETMGYVEIREVEIISVVTAGISQLGLEVYENVTTETDIGDTMGFNMDRTSDTVCNSLIHSTPMETSGGTKLPLGFITVRSDEKISMSRTSGRALTLRLKPDTKYAFKLANADAINTATTIIRIVFIEAM